MVSDLDGTLLDHHTYDFTPAAPALAELQKRNIPLVLCSSKSRAEMVKVQEKLGVPGPLIFENGGGFSYDKEPGTEVVVLGVPVTSLQAAVESIASQLGIRVRTLLDMSVEEVAELTGLAPDDASRAREREFSLPFLIVEGNPEAETLDSTARAHGLSITRGGRFHHLTGNTNKGTAVRRLRELLESRTGRRTFAVGLGDSANDLSLLQAVDWPVRIRNPWSASALGSEVQWAAAPEEPGPEGWRLAVEQWLHTAFRKYDC